MREQLHEDDDMSRLQQYEGVTADGEWAIFRSTRTGDITHIPTQNYWQNMGFGHLFSQEVETPETREIQQ